MLPVLDVNPTDTIFAESEMKKGRFVFVVQGDPRVQLARVEGVAYIRKVVLPRASYDPVTFDLEGDAVPVPTTDLVGLSRDLGIEQWGILRLGCPDAGDILAELPGPMAREIIAQVEDPDTLARLARWYRLEDAWRSESRFVLMESR